jgi:hypothetical protein
MQQKISALIVIVLLLGFAFLVGSFAGGWIGQLTVSAKHKAIIDSMTITDTAANIKITPKLVDAGNIEWAKGLSAFFVKGTTYPMSCWLWQRYGDTQMVMAIWGPSGDGKTYTIEIGRISWDPFDVKINGVTKLTIDRVTNAEPAIGYYQLQVIVD